ncbi:Uncharacterized conserved protein [Fulvimarina manganoxydans]|uniref:Uncharacterized conserved protein n=1 Tax=Fulvimarina manganoxydans TaxID=937218 RepID=A0A1W2DNP5_9HYPH|nr:extensin family protein [Fulvimarina manganoxydans]SMC99090.1 Uncharacterized conserved protein [Fulvimarina manganoxydans]
MVRRIRVGWMVGFVVTSGVAANLVAPVSAQTTGSTSGGTLVWGGRMPQPGETYRPSASAVDMFGISAPATGDPRNPPAESAYAPPPARMIAPQPDPIRQLQSDLVPTPAPARGPIATAAPQPATEAEIFADPGEADVLPPEPPTAADADTLFGGTYIPDEPVLDPWSRLKAVTPGALTEADLPKPQPSPRRQAPRSEIASLGPVPAPALEEPIRRKATPERTPSGWRNMSEREALCRAGLRQLGVEFVDLPPIQTSKSCGIALPIKVTQIAQGVAIRPAATLNCDAAFRISRWVDMEVKPAARSHLGSQVTHLINSSSYRCSRVAGTGGLSQHATGNALDVAGFKLANGDLVDVEKKGIFSPRENAFQQQVRKSACRWFGTVLGPGYNWDHRHHFHLDARERKKTFCR